MGCFFLSDALLIKASNGIVEDKTETVLENKECCCQEEKPSLKLIEVNMNETTPSNKRVDEESQEGRLKSHAKHLWVSNINRHVKANDLKKHFSAYGKVITTKILTNGKQFFGYLTMETDEQAARCVRELNNTVFKEFKIYVGSNRPSLGSSSSENGTTSMHRVTKHLQFNKHAHKRNNEVKDQAIKRKNEKLSKPSSPKIKYENETKLILDLKQKLRHAYTDHSKIKRDLNEAERKNLVLQRNIRKERESIRCDRHRLDRDREDFEKLKRSVQKQLNTEKAKILKELDEVKALHLKMQKRFDNFTSSTPRHKRKSRSPVYVSNHGETLSREGESRKKLKYDNPSLICPPSPPVLSQYNVRRTQREELVSGNRAYYSDDKKYYGQFAHNPCSDNRYSYPVSYSNKQPKRPVHVKQFMGYENQVPKAPLLVQPRNGHPHYGPSYGGF